MAAIEKICEYSGDYPSWEMYGYKHNLIQICPEYRPLFKGQEHTLYICKKIEWRFEYKWGSSTFIDDIKNFKKQKDSWLTKGKVSKEVNYCLYVPNLKGQVEGLYYNHTMDIKATKHRLSKLLGLKSFTKLNIKYVSPDEFWNLHKTVDI